jgi:hypothetical protein
MIVAAMTILRLWLFPLVSMNRSTAISLVVAACACGKSRVGPPERTSVRDEQKHPPFVDPSVKAATPSATRACDLVDLPLRIKSKGRVVALGDVHGDIDGAKAALVAARIVDNQGNWVGGDATVVQTGDVLDRGDTEQAVIDWFATLQIQASKAGGQFIALIGNHELMNAALDFRYVTPGGFRDFDDVPGLSTASEKFAGVPQRERSRVAALSPGGLYAKKFAQSNVVIIVDDTVYSHAGVLGPWVTQLDTLNREARCWLDGQAPKSSESANGDQREAPVALTADDGPVWTRALAGTDVDCPSVAATMSKLGVKHMVLGHTVQPNGISSACQDSVWRIDVGLARLYDGPIEALEIVEGKLPVVIKGIRLP